ncbi:MAG TPA: MFS transporter [Candidatus Dormibacteraeota bacterium]|nr:MFS transporter [Candidatus Dormibacteraeota bacterium]
MAAEAFICSASIQEGLQRRILWTLYGCNLITSVGMWFFLPLLPIFIGRRGGSAALVGAVFAAGLLANAAIRYPAGWAADRFGTRVVMVGSMAAYAALFLAYLLPLPLGLFVVLRFLHGAAAGAFWPAANGLIAEATPPDGRGRAYGIMQSTNMAGMLLGPAVGGFVALFNLGAVFAMSAVTCGVAAFALGMLPGAHAEQRVELPLPQRAMAITKRLLPLLLLGAGTSYMIGTFDTIWPLYMTFRGASTLAVGLSFTAFALPAMLLSAQAGSMGDRLGPRRLIIGALLATALFSAIYPFVTSVGWLIGLGLIEGALTISGAPSLIAEVSRAAPPGQQGRTQGLFQTVQTAIQIVGALAGGALFAVSPTYAFLAISTVCVLGAVAGVMPRPAARRSVSEAPTRP